MPGRTGALIVLTAGLVIVLVGLLADPVGLGTSPGFGVYQIGTVVIGLVVVVIGGAALRGSRPRR